MSKLKICKPIDELELKHFGVSKNVYNSTYSKFYTTETSDMSHTSTNLKTVKEFRDAKRQRYGVRVYKDQYRNITVDNVQSNENDYYKIKRMKHPDTNRTMDPLLRPEDENPLTRRVFSASRPAAPGNIQTLLSKTDNEEVITKCRKTPNSKVYKSIDFLYQEREDQKHRRCIAHVKYKNYDHTTQIVALPGGQKRDKYSIKDDQKFKNKKNPGHIVKIMRDYNSTIVCLPNTQTFDYPVKNRLGKQYDRPNQSIQTKELLKNEYSYSGNNLKSSLVSLTKLDNNQKMHGKPTEMVKTPTSIGKKPDFIKDVFKSQFSLG